MAESFHSVTLDRDACKGCIHCIKRCPTEAIRVRDGKAAIIAQRCIDCGECIRVCPHHAKKAITDPVSVIQDYKYAIAMVPPSLFGQFNNLHDTDRVLAGLKSMGFRSPAIYGYGKRGKELQTALEDVSFSVRKGEGDSEEGE